MNRVPEHDVSSASQPVDHCRERREVVRAVCVGHHDKPAARGRETGEIRAAVAAAMLVHDDRAGGERELHRAVLGAVVHDDHLA